MATPGSRNPGHEAFLVQLDTLRTAVTDPGGLAAALYSNGLIDRLAFQRANLTTLATLERSQELLSALDGKMAASEAAFDTFLSVIHRIPVMEDMCALLSESRGIDTQLVAIELLRRLMTCTVYLPYFPTIDILAVVCEDNEPKGQKKCEDAVDEPPRESQQRTRSRSPDPPEENQATRSDAPSSSAVVKKGNYKEHCEESFRELKANVADFVENTSMSDIVEVLEEEQVLDKVKSAILDHLS